MAVITKGSGGSIKFSGTGGSLSISSSGGGGGGGGPVMSGLIAWYRADDIAAGEGASVSSWTDRSGNGNSLSSLAGISVPTYKTSVATLNNQPAVNFSYSGLAKAFPSGYLGGNDPLTIIMVMKHASPSGVFFGLSDQTSYFSRIQGWFPANNRIGLDFVGPTWYVDVPAANPIIWYYSLDEGQSIEQGTYLINNAVGANSQPQPAYPPQGLNITSPVTRFSIGGQGTSGPGYDFSGDVAEVLFYNTALNATDRATTQSYLASRYGITLA